MPTTDPVLFACYILFVYFNGQNIARIERGVNGGNGFRIVAVAVEFGHSHAPESDAGNFEVTEPAGGER